MIQDNVNEYLGFFNAVGQMRSFQPTSAEELAKYLSIPVPDALKGATIEQAQKNHKRGKHSFSMSSLKYPGLSWPFSFLSQSKCYLVCVDHGDHVHCVHICVTCFDGWPGPGCYLHGSYD